MNRSRVKAGNRFLCALVALALVLGGSARARADDGAAPNFWFAGTQLIFDDPEQHDGALAIGIGDAGLARFLAKAGATLAYQPKQKYIVVTAADHRTIAFAIGDASFSVGGDMQAAAFAPYVTGGVVYLPFLDLARALYVDPVDGGSETVLQPQLAALEVHTEGRVTTVTLRGAMPLSYKRLSDDDDDDVALAFSGTASTLEANRRIGGSALVGISIAVSGPARNVQTVVHFSAAPGTAHALLPTQTPNVISLAFAPGGVALGGAHIPLAAGPLRSALPYASNVPPEEVPAPASATALPTPPAVPLAEATPTAEGLPTATIASVLEEPSDANYGVRLELDGDVTYEWHRLSDDRWYVDLKPATLAIPAVDEVVSDPSVLSLRVKPFIGPLDHLPTVRVAFTLTSPRAVEFVPFAGGLSVEVDRVDDTSGITSDAGELSNGKLISSIVPLPPPPSSPPEIQTPSPADTWKFSPSVSSSTNPRLIVIDPGHGGSDTGAMHNGLVEKEITLDVSKRLRTLLLARGWQVKMTRETDVDVYAPNDSARDELQARCDIANNAGARLFVSIHVNSFTDGSQSGTTTFYYKADSYGFAQAVHNRLASLLPTQDDGIRKDNFYVIHHTTMPAILVETAFLSNAGDAALLRSDAFLQKIAVSVADGIGDYASVPPAPLSSTDDQNTDGN